MRILHVAPTYLPAVRYGGTIAATHGLCRALADAGHEVGVCTTSVDGPGDSPVPHGTPICLDGVSVRYFRSPALRRLYWSPAMARALPALVGAADVVHLHSIYLWPTWAAARAARRAGVPYVLSPRGMLEKELVRRRSPRAKALWLALVERRNLERAAAVHFTSERERREAARFGYGFRREAVIPNGVGVPAQAPAAEPPAAAGAMPCFLFLGRISWKKGIDRLLRALALVEGVRLVVAGNDDERLWPRLAALAGELGIAARVEAVGMVGEEEKSRHFARALGLVAPSYSENFGNVVLEAMAAGCPVVVTPEVGAAEIVEGADAGIVVPGDAASLGGALAALARDPGLRARLGARGRAAAAGFSWASVAARMADLYAAVREGRARG